MTIRHDYRTLERQFVAGEMSIRELCRRHLIRNASPVHARARADDWYGKRLIFRERAGERTIDRLADSAARRAERQAEVVDHGLEVVDAALTRLEETLAATRQVERNGVLINEPVVEIGAKELASVIDALVSLLDHRVSLHPAVANDEPEVSVDILGQIVTLVGGSDMTDDRPFASVGLRHASSALTDDESS
jgi:hypothetical protein